ncbi:MAG: DnaJ domain-containing protein [Acidobacteriota bacterium]|nr:DnaJ domain-containing protein [Acidobacteriota bacterium]
MPWALGRLWRLWAVGVLQTTGRLPRAFFVYHGDLAGAWMTPEDPVLSPGSVIQMALTLQPRYLETGPVAAAGPILQVCRDLAQKVGSGPWAEILYRLVRDVTVQPTPLTWTPLKALHLPEGLPFVAAPSLLWRLAQEVGGALEKAAQVVSSPLPDAARSQLRMELEKDARLPPTVRSALADEAKTPTDAGTRFLSFFWIPGPVASPAVPVRAPSPPAVETPVRLEEYVHRWEELRAYAHQSRRWTHYQVLGLTPDATLDQIRDRYRRLAAVFHPDRWPQADELQRSVVTRLFGRIQTAHQVLSDEAKRRQYDRSLQTEGPAYEVVQTRTGRIDPKTLKDFYVRGVRAFLKGDMPEAVRWLESVATATSEWIVELILALAESYVPERRHTAAQRLEHLTQAHPEAAEVWWVYACVLYRWNFQARAHQALEEVKRRNPALLKQWGPPEKPDWATRKAFLRFLQKVAEAW